MELNSLLNESVSAHKSMQADAARLAEKWSATGLLEGLGNEIEKNNMSVILENQAKQIISEANATNANGGAEQWAGVALPLVRKVFAQIAAKDFVSVQPMNLPSGLVFYLDFKYGTAANGRSLNENMYGNVSTLVLRWLLTLTLLAVFTALVSLVTQSTQLQLLLPVLTQLLQLQLL